MRVFLPAALAALCLTGCAANSSPATFSSQPAPQHIVAPYQPVPAQSSALPYHSYGDSITEGYSLQSPQTGNYAYLLAQAQNLTLTNAAIPGDQACDIPTRQIFPAQDSPAIADYQTLYTVLISTNDVNAKGPGAYEAVFNLCHQATLAWLGIPLEAKILGSDPSISTTGPTHLDTSNNWNALITDGLGATLNFPVARKHAGPIYVWYRIGDNNPGAFTYSLDGTQLGSLTTATATPIHTQNGSTDSMALLRIPNIQPGDHTLTFTQTTSGQLGMGVVAVATPGDHPFPSTRVLVGTTPMQYNGQNVPCNSPDASNCAAYIADITANVKVLAHDNLNIQLFDSRKYMTGTAADMIDSVHPNPQGHHEILQAIIDIY